MEKKVDQRGKLEEEVFSCRVTKDKKVFISWNSKVVTTLSGPKADQFIGELKGLDSTDAQLLMAKATGHFKHGNEQNAKKWQ